MKPNPIEERLVVVRLRIVAPPAGVRFCLQRGSSERVGAVTATAGAELVFECELRAQPVPGDAKGVRFLGPFTQGPPAARFIYVCSGAYAGQVGSCWGRRAKIPLSGITWTLVEQAASGGGKLTVSFGGTAKDGGPVCASVKLGHDAWRVE